MRHRHGAEIATSLLAASSRIFDFSEPGFWKRPNISVDPSWRVLCTTIVHGIRDLSGNWGVAARSGPRNIAEGFARWHHRDFARFTRIAKASEIELLNHFIEAADSGHISKEERTTLEHAARKAIKAANGLIRYLENNPDPTQGVKRRNTQAP